MKIGLLEQKTYKIYTFYTWDGIAYQCKKTKLDLEEIQKNRKYTFASDMDLIVTLNVKDVETTGDVYKAIKFNQALLEELKC